MFTGIISEVGKTVALSPRGTRGQEFTLTISGGYADVQLGESIAVNGVCLTATEVTTDGQLRFDVSSETCARTMLGSLRAGDPVNLERALRLADRVSGHLVQGHVDGLGRLVRVTPGEAGSHEIEVEIPQGLRKYMIEKGSIALDGISLTINSVKESTICLMIIPHTWKHTHLFSKQVGQDLNLEADMVVKTLYAFHTRGA